MFLRSKRKRIATIMTPTKQYKNKMYGRGALEQTKSQRGVLFGYSQRLYIVELYQICSSLEGRLTARLAESKQWHDHLTIVPTNSAPWGVNHVVTRCSRYGCGLPQENANTVPLDPPHPSH